MTTSSISRLPALNRRITWLSLFLLSAATFSFEITLTRLFSVAQFYHFAFMIVSVALLGYGASGTVLAIFPALQQGKPTRRVGRLALSAGVSILVAYLFINMLPFDSYSLVWDRRQVFILIFHYAALATPFFFSGMALATLLAQYPDQAGSSYAVNLLGSAMGCVIALLAPAILGGEGMVTLSSLLAVIAGLIALWMHSRRDWQVNNYLIVLSGIILLLVNLLDLTLRLTSSQGLDILALHISPYKSLSYARQYPGSATTFQRWNAFSRVDVVNSAGIHSLPGLSYRYLEALPTLEGLFVDADDLNPIVPLENNNSFTAYLPNAIAFQLHPHAKTLVLEPRGGLDIVTALSQGVGSVIAVEMNPLIVEANPLYASSHLQEQIESDRSFLQRTGELYDVIVLSLVSSYHPVQSGAYTLAEDYRYTVEAFSKMLEHLAPGGYLVATRWLQDPPSEDLRLFALAVTALEATGADPHQQLVAFRGYNTGTILVKQGSFTAAELGQVRNFTHQRAFDLSYAPDIQAEETNKFNILPTSTYYQTYLNLLDAQSREAFYDSYPYEVRPPTDDHPFFGHYFKWGQTPQILAEFGKAWLPFGGGGYLVILALLLLAILLASILIILPVWVWKRGKTHGAGSPYLWRNLLYFGLLGFAFLLVEIPLLQRFILYLGNAAYAFTAVLFALLFFSGIGSYFSQHLSLRLILILLTLSVVAMPLLLPALFDLTLGLPVLARLIITVLALSPLGFLMGVPFPAGICTLSGGRTATDGIETEIAERRDIAWIWGVNGATSVVAPIVSALLALTFGFRLVLWVGAVFYAAALVTALVLPLSESHRR